MKRLIVCLICLYAISASALPIEGAQPSRMMHPENHNNGVFSLTTTNFANAEDLHYLHSQKLLYMSASWISGKKYRRDALGQLLYWATYPPSSNNNQMISQTDPLWTEDMVMVQDTLTTVGFDGDMEVYEFLPAYNGLLVANMDAQDLYGVYNTQDRVLQSIMGSPAPLPFDPFGSTNFCFSIPQPGSFETPGFITDSAYYYDYCPFGTLGDRDFGSSSSRSTHHPLGLAVHQESYSWNLQNHDKMLIMKHTVYNTNELDSIQDLAISHFVDADLGPSTGGTEIASDDVSGYVKGAGYEFAYSRDFDGDNGLSPTYIGSKLIIPDFTDYGLRNAWFWKVGDGPNDTNPLNLATSNQTANEKYWLATGRNPNSSKFLLMRLEDPDTLEYEQPAPNDTRFLNTLHGALPGTPEYAQTDDQGNYIYRLNLEPQESISYYTVLFMGDSLAELKSRSLQIETFIENGLQIDPDPSLTCIPYLMPVECEEPDTFDLIWHSYTDPERFELKYKAQDAPDTDWNMTILPGSARDYSLSGMDADTWYQIKVGSVYYSPEEVYLESETKLINLSHVSIGDEHILPLAQIRNYPNPFSGKTNIEYELKESAAASLEIYNIRGQKVRSFNAAAQNPGIQNLSWDGRDDGGKVCASGIYYLRLQAGKQLTQRKMLLVK